MLKLQVSMASRVPLLVKSKGRKPSRVSIAPRAKPSNGPRIKRPATPDSITPSNNATEQVNHSQASKLSDKPTATADKEQTARALNTARPGPPLVKTSAAKPSNVTKSVTVAKPSATAKPKPTPIATGAAVATSSGSGASPSALLPRRAGGITIGGSLSSTSPSAVSKSPGTRPVPTVRSPIVLPMQRRPERLAKITSAGPVYRETPVVRPRAGSIGASPSMRPRAGSTGSSPAAGSQNVMKQRLLRKLDIKPHQSPRRSAMQQLRTHDGPASPLLLGGKPSPDASKDIPDVQLDSQQSRRATTTKPKAVPTKKKRPAPAKRRKTSETTEAQTSSTPQRRSLRRKAKRSTYRDTDDSGSSASEFDGDDVDPNDLDLPENETNVYVPARERATMWAKSLLKDEGEKDDTEAAKALVTKTPTRRKRSNSNASAASSVVTGIGGGILPRSKIEELLKKEPSQMTMGELALTVPKGKRVKRHEREEAALDTPLPASQGSEGSNLLDVDALKRVRSLSVSSESAAFAGSLVTPQVQIIDGQMVVMENTIKLGDELQRTADSLGETYAGGESGLPPRHSGARYSSSHVNGPGKRWGKEETKQFYYCLSQVGPNFSMMATLFPTRKRKELKSKFKYEEKNHSKLIEIALRASAAPLDSEMVDVIARMVDKEAKRKLEAQKKKRKPRSQLDPPRQDDDTASVASSVVSSPMSAAMSTPQAHTEEEFVETLTDEDLFPPSRRGSFDFSG
ncbi:Transcription factor TFIIIB component B'' [Phytophthora citrophthora]|uniref:Transcription factor TFIIIB component B n=1 Tax=Phytophthora citrophthora TaxID=4793 RepID=A0AAD9GQ38_9STRA|nr:Transcription factor TFIIIB component B'' [Phytophthora citrophthora]